MNKKGFTLAEILVSLGIIGVVAAMTIPNLLHDTSKQEAVSKLEKEYTSLSQAVKMSEINNGNNATWDWGSTSDPASITAAFATLWAPYLRISKYCTSYSDCGYTSNTPWLFTDGITSCATVVANSERTAIILADGSLIVIGFVGGLKQIWLDTNGAKGPNIMGRDVFVFVLDEKKGFVPFGYDQPTFNINDSCKKSNWGGKSCAAKIMQDSWQIKDDYPWK